MVTRARGRMMDITNIEATIRLAEAASKRRDWAAAIRYWQTILDYQGSRAPKRVRVRLSQAHQALNSAEALARNRLIFRALAEVHKVIWVNPEDILRKLSERVDLTLYPGAILEGDWDLQSSAIADSPKHRSIVRHFVEGVAWEDTELLRKHHLKRLARGEPVRGCKSIAELKRQYQETIDPLFTDMKERGFVLPEDASRYVKYIPHVHIGRTGDILYGRRGNHRLSIAKILGLQRFPCMVHTRHTEWQGLREKVLNRTLDDVHTLLDPKLVRHPDMADLIATPLE